MLRSNKHFSPYDSFHESCDSVKIFVICNVYFANYYISDAPFNFLCNNELIFFITIEGVQMREKKMVQKLKDKEYPDRLKH